jgi:ferritin
MLKKKVEDLCNRQVEREGYSSKPLSCNACWAETLGMAGVCSLAVFQARRRKGAYAQVH